MFFRKMHFGWVRFNRDLQGHWTKLHRSCFAERRTNRHRRNDYPILNIFIRFGDIRRRTLKSSEIGPNFACFLPRNFFGVCPPKFWNGIIKFSEVLTIMQNFTPVGPRISEISRCNKTSAVKQKSFRRTNDADYADHRMSPLKRHHLMNNILNSCMLCSSFQGKHFQGQSQLSSRSRLRPWPNLDDLQGKCQSQNH